MSINMRFLFLPIAFAIISCAPVEKAIPPMTNEIFRAQEESEKALRIASADSIRIVNLNLKLDLFSKRLDYIDSSLSIILLTLPKDNQLQLIPLYEEIAKLRKLIEEQNKRNVVSSLIKISAKEPVKSDTSAVSAPDSLATGAANVVADTSAVVQDTMPAEYETAKDLLLKKDYPAAANLFEETAKKYPTNSFASDSWYWNGESQMAMGNYAKAISAFQKVLMDLKTTKAADAEYQIAVCFFKIGNKEQARASYRRVIEFYPQNFRAAQAKKELDKMK